MKSSQLITPLLILLALSSCEDHEESTKINKDIEDKISIKQGIYGLTYSVNDAGNTNEKIISDFRVIIKQGLDVDTVRSDWRGIYQTNLNPGEYEICTSFGRCTTISLGNEIMRCDYEFSVGPGWSCGEIPANN